MFEFVEGKWRQKGKAIEQYEQIVEDMCVSADGNFLVRALHPFQYDPKSDSWITMKPLPVGIANRTVASVLCSANGRTVMASQQSLGSNDVYIPVNVPETGFVQVFRAVEHP